MGFSGTTVVKGPTGDQIKSSWDLMLSSGTIDQSLQAAGVFSSAYTYWTGTGVSGQDVGVDCLDWTSQSTDDSGNIGRADQTGNAWIQDSQSQCNEANKLVCVCYSA